MTRDQAGALTDAWLSEMWPVVREYREGETPPKRSGRPVRKPRDEPDAPRESCPVCGGRFLSADVLTHILRSHPESVQKPGDSGEVGAA